MGGRRGSEVGGRKELTSTTSLAAAAVYGLSDVL